MPENTIESTLQATIELLQKENAALKQENASLQNANATVTAENKAHKEAAAKLQEENQALSEVNDELTAKVEELSIGKNVAEAAEKVAEAKPVKLPADNFEVGGKKYRFASPVFIYAGQRILAEDALQDQKLLASLVKAKSSVITEAKA